MSSSHKLIRVTALSEEMRSRSPIGRGIKSPLNAVGSLLVLLFILMAASGCERASEQAPVAPASVQESIQQTPGSDTEVEATEEDQVEKVVYHADFADPRRFSAMLTSINNMATTYQNELVEYDIRIVFIAHGIRFVTDDKLTKTPFAEDKAMAERRESNKGRLLSLNEVQGVKLELCNITRSEIGLPEEAVYEVVDLVPSGVVRIAELQKQGFAYLKIE